MKVKPPRSILITGASSGIGLALARRYAGPSVFLALSGRDADRLAATALACREKGAAAEATSVDVKDRDAMARWIARTDAAHPLDLVIANAGVSGGPGSSSEDEELVREIFAVNMAGVLNTVLPAAAAMGKRKRGRIAIMSSLAGLRGMPTGPAYSASKAAVRAYGEGLRGLLARENISVSVICPGFVESRITARNKFPMPFLMSSDKAARIIQRGLARNKARIAFPWQMYWPLWLLSVLPPGLGDMILNRLPKKV